jgi:hypothetical protein
MQLHQRAAHVRGPLPQQHHIRIANAPGVLQPPAHRELVPVVHDDVIMAVSQLIDQLIQQTAGCLAAAPLGTDEADREGGDRCRPAQLIFFGQNLCGCR